jgi:hypothetical protein
MVSGWIQTGSSTETRWIAICGYRRNKECCVVGLNNGIQHLECPEADVVEGLRNRRQVVIPDITIETRRFRSP